MEYGFRSWVQAHRSPRNIMWAWSHRDHTIHIGIQDTNDGPPVFKYCHMQLLERHSQSPTCCFLESVNRLRKRGSLCRRQRTRPEPACDCRLMEQAHNPHEMLHIEHVSQFISLSLFHFHSLSLFLYMYTYIYKRNLLIMTVLIHLPLSLSLHIHIQI